MHTGFKFLMFFFAVLIVMTSLIFTNRLVRKIKETETNRIHLWAEAYKDILSTDLEKQVNPLSFRIIYENVSIPVIMTDERDNIISYANLDSVKSQSGVYLQKKLAEMKSANAPIVIDYSQNNRNYIYYNDSLTLILLQKYPYFQFALIAIFLFILYLMLHYSKRAEDNSIWVGMSRETAHQLGTPISSLIAWIEMLKIQQPDDPLLPEVKKDVQRLELITERFARIGSEPQLLVSDINSVIIGVVDYLRVRTSSKVIFEVNMPDEEILLNMNKSLMRWVIENICKNAIDAMQGAGNITITLKRSKKKIIILFTDTGKGLSKRDFKRIFRPGYSTKKVGWGLGLALVKRIVEVYHDGRVYVLSSEVGVGTTFAVELKPENA